MIDHGDAESGGNAKNTDDRKTGYFEQTNAAAAKEINGVAHRREWG